MKKTLLILLIAVAVNASAQSPSWNWAKSAGGIDFEGEPAVAVDNSGNAYMSGSFSSSSVTFGSFTIALSSAGNVDLFVVKYDSSGNVLWANSAGSTGIDRAFSVTADASGNCYLAGTFDSPTITFGTTTLTNTSTSYDWFLVKYDTNGNVLWAKSGGGSSNEFIISIDADASGNCFIGGYYYSPTLTFGTTTLTNSGSPDVFLAKFDTNGNALWAKSGTGTSFGLELITMHWVILISVQRSHSDHIR
jgi:hypothetical protein